MKKILLTVVVTFAITTLTNAQNIKFGLKGGLSLNTPSFEVTDATGNLKVNTKIKPSFYIGGITEYTLESVSDKFGIELQANFTKNTFEFEKDFIYRTLSFNQINIPVMAKYEVIENGFVKGGVYGAFIIGADYTYKNNTKNVSDEMSSFDYGIPIGLEYNLNNGLFFESLFNIGFADLSKKDGSNKVNILNRLIQIGVGYKF